MHQHVNNYFCLLRLEVICYHLLYIFHIFYREYYYYNHKKKKNDMKFLILSLSGDDNSGKYCPTERTTPQKFLKGQNKKPLTF